MHVLRNFRVFLGPAVCNGPVSVRLSILLSTAAAASGRFAAERPVGRRYRSIAAQCLAPISSGAAAARRAAAANAGSDTSTGDVGS